MVLNKHNDIQLKGLIHDILQFKRDSLQLCSAEYTEYSKTYANHRNNIIEYMKISFFDEKLYSELYKLLIDYGIPPHVCYGTEFKSKWILKEHVGFFVYYREIFKYNNILFKIRLTSLDEIEYIVKNLEEYGITEFETEVLKISFVIKVLTILPDDYDNDNVLRLFCSNFPNILKLSIRDFDYNNDLFEKNKCKFKDICNRYGKEVVFK